MTTLDFRRNTFYNIDDIFTHQIKSDENEFEVLFENETLFFNDRHCCNEYLTFWYKYICINDELRRCKERKDMFYKSATKIMKNINGIHSTNQPN